MSESAKIDKRKKKAKPSGLRPRDYAGTIHFHMNGSLHKMTGISISNQYPGPHKAHCAACNSTFKIDWGVILSIKQYEVAKSRPCHLRRVITLAHAHTLLGTFGRAFFHSPRAVYFIRMKLKRLLMVMNECG